MDPCYVIALCTATIACVLETAVLAIMLISKKKKEKSKTYTFHINGKTIDHRLTKDEANAISDLVSQYTYETGEQLLSFSEKIL